ncbi:four-carbon acid sugar kinase family protein [Desertivirga xinjiangensis]|uniref:four-carbon acid sugar kinase family protein n=1 Tax=Desertivirga xinjiangensis TaxID=539206 RepID=UPI002108E83B|nr:four-carbon acid sugar kinase family protein [Pedobacter xinjiangensis]
MPLLITFYGDDFTGSTDALDFLSKAGIKTVLFIEPPSKEQLSRYKDVEAIGVAGKTRAMKPDDMEEELNTAFSSLKNLQARHVHYKVCSTFDSSPDIGSIGKAIEVGAKIFEAGFIPLLVAAPVLGRYCAFGNLFARMGIGSNGSIYRLDRHPSMSKHPTTPADESDLRLHLSRQTDKKSGLIDILQIEEEFSKTKAAVDRLLSEGNEIILFDAMYQQQMARIGEVIDSYSSADKTVFSVGSSGIEMALGAFWKEKGMISTTPDWTDAGAVGPVLVVSGSCSPVTSGQIAYALANGFKEVAIDTEALAAGGNSSEIANEHARQAALLLSAGENVLVHTSRGNDDIRVRNTERIFTEKGMPKTETALLYGTLLGEISRKTAELYPLKRIIIAGGDTSSYAARAMGIEAVEMIAPLSPGAPLCKAYAPGSSIDGMEVNFKGGQVGKEDYFLSAAG